MQFKFYFNTFEVTSLITNCNDAIKPIDTQMSRQVFKIVMFVIDVSIKPHL